MFFYVLQCQEDYEGNDRCIRIKGTKYNVTANIHSQV